MIKRTKLHHAVAAAFLLASGASNLAFAVDEVEPNDQIGAPQRLTVGPDGRVEVFGAIGLTTLGGTAAADVDFFSFEAQAGDVLTVDIDQGMKPRDLTVRSVDTTIVIYGPLPDLRKKRESTNMNSTLPRDPGSDDFRDALIENFRADAAGTYVVGVSSQPRFLTDNGGTTSTSVTGAFSNGSYRLIISGVTPPVLVQHINIEVKPGSTGDAPVNPKSKGNIPLALLSHAATASSPAFDALQVKRESLTFGSTGDEKSWLRCAKEGVDVNADGLLDLVCHFENVLADWQPDDVEGKVKGTTGDGRQFEGAGRLKVVPKHRD